MEMNARANVLASSPKGQKYVDTWLSLRLTRVCALIFTFLFAVIITFTFQVFQKNMERCHVNQLTQHDR